VPRSLEANQAVKIRAQHGPPKPCSIMMSRRQRISNFTRIPLNPVMTNQHRRLSTESGLRLKRQLQRRWEAADGDQQRLS